MILTFILIIAFPVILGAGYGALYLIQSLFAPRSGTIHRFGFLLYPLFLAVPFGVALHTALSNHALAQFGLRVPDVSSLSPSLSVVIAIVVGTGTGYGLFRYELYVVARLRRSTRTPFGLRRPLQGQSPSVIRDKQHIPFGLMTTVSVFVVVAEEFLWRGCLIHYLQEFFSLQLFWALTLSSISFGLIHYHFGAHHIILKCVSGFIWGILYLLCSSILVSISSHYTFDYLVWRRIRTCRS